MTLLEQQMYAALLAARTVVAATANVNPQALRIKQRIDAALSAYKAAEKADNAITAAAPAELEESAHADGD